MSAPLKTFKISLVEVAIWQAKYGVNISIQKSYKDEQGAWKRTGNLNLGEAIIARRLLDDAIQAAIITEGAKQKERQPSNQSSEVADWPVNDGATGDPFGTKDDEVPF